MRRICLDGNRPKDEQRKSKKIMLATTASFAGGCRFVASFHHPRLRKRRWHHQKRERVTTPPKTQEDEKGKVERPQIRANPAIATLAP